MYVTYIRIAVLIVACLGLGIMYGCGSSAWDDTKQADTYEAYRAYIENNPEGEHLEEAKKRADNSYWNSIKNDTTAMAFETYLDKFPNGQFRSQAQTKLSQVSLTKSKATEARVTGSNVIIRSDHTTESPSAGVVAKAGTIVQILEQYNSTGSNEAILKRSVTVVKNGNQINLPEGKAIRVVTDRQDSVNASFITPNYGAVEAMIGKNDIEAIGGEKWYKIHTKDNITGWIYGKFIEEL